ncbi:MAG: chloride channel protein [Asticcacaulis sp.]
MTHQNLKNASTTPGLPISLGIGPVLEKADIAHHPRALDRRSLSIGIMCIGLGLIMVPIAFGLMGLIGLITNLVFYGRISTELVSPAGNSLGLWVIAIPVIGSLIIGLMARYGSRAIRGHGIPEAMEQILTNDSRIPVRMTFLKPLSAAISIGTGGPFGAEGPIIATGGALGSLLGQVIHVTADERKILLAAGAAAGMTAIFGTPFSAIFLAIELLVFEFRPRSFIPVALASLSAIILRPYLFGTDPLFHFAPFAAAGSTGLIGYALLGLVMGLFSVVIAKSTCFIEDLFEHLPIHWMWWPAIGGLVVGIVGYFEPQTMGVGYGNIDRIISGDFLGTALLVFCLLKFVSWSIALGSGTSGGTLAPIFTIGGGLGVLIAQALEATLPMLTIDVRMAGLVGMAACFAGASRAIFASVLFALEVSGQFNTLLPLLAACSTAMMVSALIMKNTIMTEKLARRGHHVPSEYTAN